MRIKKACDTAILVHLGSTRDPINTNRSSAYTLLARRQLCLYPSVDLKYLKCGGF